MKKKLFSELCNDLGFNPENVPEFIKNEQLYLEDEGNSFLEKDLKDRDLLSKAILYEFFPALYFGISDKYVEELVIQGYELRDFIRYFSDVIDYFTVNKLEGFGLNSRGKNENKDFKYSTRYKIKKSDFDKLKNITKSISEKISSFENLSEGLVQAKQKFEVAIKNIDMGIKELENYGHINSSRASYAYLGINVLSLITGKSVSALAKLIHTDLTNAGFSVTKKPSDLLRAATEFRNKNYTIEIKNDAQFLFKLLDSDLTKGGMAKNTFELEPVGGEMT